MVQFYQIPINKRQNVRSLEPTAVFRMKYIKTLFFCIFFFINPFQNSYAIQVVDFQAKEYAIDLKVRTRWAYTQHQRFVDWNQDGLIDVISSQEGEEKLVVYYQLPSGGFLQATVLFEEQIELSNGIDTLEIVDLNYDNYPDFIFSIGDKLFTKVHGSMKTNSETREIAVSIGGVGISVQDHSRVVLNNAMIAGGQGGMPDGPQGDPILVDNTSVLSIIPLTAVEYWPLH